MDLNSEYNFKIEAIGCTNRVDVGYREVKNNSKIFSLNNWKDKDVNDKIGNTLYNWCSRSQVKKTFIRERKDQKCQMLLTGQIRSGQRNDKWISQCGRY